MTLIHPLHQSCAFRSMMEFSIGALPLSLSIHARCVAKPSTSCLLSSGFAPAQPRTRATRVTMRCTNEEHRGKKFSSILMILDRSSRWRNVSQQVVAIIGVVLGLRHDLYKYRWHCADSIDIRLSQTDSNRRSLYNSEGRYGCRSHRTIM